MARTFKIKISGSGTADQLAVRLNDIVRQLQVANVHDGLDELEGTYEDSILITEIKEEE